MYRLLTIAAVALVTIRASGSAHSAEARIEVYYDGSRACGGSGSVVWKRLGPKIFVTTVKDLLDYDVLRRYDLLLVCNQDEHVEYTRSELEAVSKFVKEGGGVLLIADPRRAGVKAAKFRGGTPVEAPGTMPIRGFCSAQLAQLFGVSFINLFHKGQPTFVSGHHLNAGTDCSKLVFSEQVGCLACAKRMGWLNPAPAFDIPRVTPHEMVLPDEIRQVIFGRRNAYRRISPVVLRRSRAWDVAKTLTIGLFLLLVAFLLAAFAYAEYEALTGPHTTSTGSAAEEAAMIDSLMKASVAGGVFAAVCFPLVCVWVKERIESWPRRRW